MRLAVQYDGGISKREATKGKMMATTTVQEAMTARFACIDTTPRQMLAMTGAKGNSSAELTKLLKVTRNAVAAEIKPGAPIKNDPRLVGRVAQTAGHNVFLHVPLANQPKVANEIARMRGEDRPDKNEAYDYLFEAMRQIMLEMLAAAL